VKVKMEYFVYKEYIQNIYKVFPVNQAFRISVLFLILKYTKGKSCTFRQSKYYDK